MKNGLIIDEEGNKRYYLNDELHRENGPAKEYTNGSKYWYLDGGLHREDGPAAEYANGSKYWYLNGGLHREDGPAVIWSNGSKFWYLHNKEHCEDGPAIELADGSKLWYLHGKELEHPKEFKNMEAFIHELNDNEEYSLPWINDINGMIGFIKKPSGKQTRLNAMRWKI